MCSSESASAKQIITAAMWNMCIKIMYHYLVPIRKIEIKFLNKMQMLAIFKRIMTMYSLVEWEILLD